MNLELDITADDRERLEKALPRGYDIDDVVEKVSMAGVREALDYATGRAVFSSMADLRSYRIFCLVRQGVHLAQAEVLVANLFKVPPTTARRLVNSAVARYAVELDESLDEEVSRTLDVAAWNTEADRWELAMPTVFLRDRILDVLSRSEQPDPSPAHRGAVWQFPDETFAWLRGELGLEPMTHDE